MQFQKDLIFSISMFITIIILHWNLLSFKRWFCKLLEETLPLLINFCMYLLLAFVKKDPNVDGYMMMIIL